jgi:hypothetical protein
MTKRRIKARGKVKSTGPVLDQLSGATVAAANAARVAARAAALGRQDTAYSEALAEIQVTRIFVNDTAHVLGSEATKHGELAEAVEVGVRRAQDALHQRDYSAHDELNRTSKVDYWIEGDAVQSKFVNGSNKGLASVLEHMDSYKEFGRDGSSHYHIPKDQYEQIAKVHSGEATELSAKSVRAIQEKIAAIEAETGKPFEEVVKPATSTYAEVQQSKVNETLDRHEDSLEQRSEELKDDIRTEHGPSLQDGLKTAAFAGVVAGGFGFAASAGRKYFEEDKNIFRGEFTSEDWKEVGLDTGKAAAAGAVTAGAVYFLTNYVGTSAPLASAFVSTAKGLHVLVKRHDAGELEAGEFEDQALLLCTDVAMVSLASAAGQALIPVPVLGALIGSFAGKIACELLKDASESAAQAVRQRMGQAQAQLDKAYKGKLQELEAMFLPSMTMTQYAFDIENNRALLAASLTLARMQGVPEARLIKSADESLAFLKAPPSTTSGVETRI